MPEAPVPEPTSTDSGTAEEKAEDQTSSEGLEAAADEPVEDKVAEENR
jgi:hypothetical protein